MKVRLKRDALLDLVARSSISQNHWAIKVGLSKGHWSQIINGKHENLSPRTRDRIIEAFGVTFDDLFEVVVGQEHGAGHEFGNAISDSYLIDREIGEGGMGVVYLARDLKHGRTVAIKAVSPEAVSGIGGEQFLKEIRTTSRLQHPNIVPLYDSGLAAGHPYYVLPYLRHGSLRDHLKRRGRLSVSETMALLRGIVAALEFAHARHVLHCDIKPENILLEGTHAYVADFGIARAIHAEFFEWGRRDELDSSAGTPAYVSPEQAAGHRDLTPASDVYSLACVVFEMLSGQPPFSGTSTMQVISQRFTSSPPDLREYAPHIPRNIAYAINQGMEFAVERRPDTPGRFLKEMEVAVSAGDRPSVLGASLRGLSRAASALTRVTGSRRRWKGIVLVEHLIQDIRFSFRSLLRAPLFAVIAIATLSIAIAANAAVFGVIQTVLLAPLDYPNADRLVALGRSRSPDPRFLSSISPWYFTNLRDEVQSLDRMSAFGSASSTITGLDTPFRVPSFVVTEGYFETFGLVPQLGRFFGSEEELQGAPPSVVISDALWRNRLNADSSIVGRTLIIDGEPREVIGVAPPGFTFRGDPVIGFQTPALWLPMEWSPGMLQSTGNNFLRAWGRLAAGYSVEDARVELTGIWDRLALDDPVAPEGFTAAAKGLQGHLTKGVKTPLMLLAGAVGLVLLIAAANVTNLMLALAEGRTRELAVRSALGAPRGRIIRYFVTESVLIALVGCVVGIGLAHIALVGVTGMLNSSFPRVEELGLSPLAWLYALGVGVAVGVAVGIVPAMSSRNVDIQSTLREGGRGAVGRASRLRSGLVIVEMALALLLVTGAGLLIRSFMAMQSVDLGVNTAGVLKFDLSLPVTRYDTSERINVFYRELTEQIASLPGVEEVGGISRVPFLGGNMNTLVNEAGNPDNAQRFTELRYVTPGYFDAMGMRLLDGRGPSWDDVGDAEPVTLVNETLAESLFPDESPVGKSITLGGGTPIRVIGLVTDVREFGPTSRLPPAIYVPYGLSGNSGLTVVVRASTEPAGVMTSVRGILSDMDSELPTYQVATMESLLADNVGPRRLLMTMLSIFAGTALLLGSVGIYGVMAFVVQSQRREMGIRLALGGSAGGVLRLVVTRGLKLAFIGVAIGGAGAFVARKLVEAFLYEVEAWDPLSYSMGALVLVAAATLACLVPAMRASRVDPLEVLRTE